MSDAPRNTTQRDSRDRAALAHPAPVAHNAAFPHPDTDMDQRRNLAILTVAQALGMAASPMNTLVGGIVGTKIAPSPALATLPVALMIVGLALATVPAAMFMRRHGRRAGFMLGAFVAGAASVCAAIAVQREWFAIYCLATLVMGSNLAFVQQYRFAAAESVAPERVSRAVSWVLMGTLAAAFLGPEIANRAMPAAGLDRYAVAYLMAAVVLVVAGLLLSRYRNGDAAPSAAARKSRSLRELLQLPGYRLAILAAATGYGVMVFLMTATPISMHMMDGHSLGHTAFVIQSHIAAMYLPSLASGRLIARFGERRLIAAGVLVLGACLLTGALGHGLPVYWTALVLLGIGWNFLFVGGTTLLTRQYRPEERFRAQAANDFIVFSVTASASLLSGTAIHALGWNWLLLLGAAPLLLLTLAMIGWREVVNAPRTA